MADQIKELFGIEPDNLEDFALASQISQAEAKKFFVEMVRVKKWRRTGVLWWNVIDCWPQFSDAIVDYYFGRKLAYHYLKRVQQPVCLMVTEPENYIDDFLKIGAEYITFHIEIGGRPEMLGERRWVYVIDKVDERRILNLIGRIRKAGRKAGLTLNPPTEIEKVHPFLDKIDLLLLMSVNPGFAGQGFIDNVYGKIEAAATFRRDHKLGFEIMVDGGVDLGNAKRLYSIGADILVSGSSFFKSSNYSEFIEKIKS